jgi:GTP pyrophosphokinase
VPIRHVLSNGDRVSIITSKNQKPKQDWLSFTVTSKAKTRIKQALNDEKVKAAAEGRETLLRRLKNWKIDFNDALVRSLLAHYNLPSARELYFMVYSEKIDLLEIKDFIKGKENVHPHQEARSQAGAGEAITPDSAAAEPDRFGDFLVIENRVEGLDYKLSKCCNPVFGDKVFGFVTITEGIKIHRTNCPNAPFMMSNYPYRIVMARWTVGEDSASFQTAIKITGIDDLGMITRIHEAISSYRVTLRNFNYENRDGMFEGMIYLFVSNINVLNGLIKKLQSLKGVIRAARYDK